MTAEEEIRLRRGFADLFRARRLELDISQEELAARTGYSQANISRLERGAAFPSIPRLIIVARVLGIDIGELAGLEPESNGDEAAA